jgi:HEAT repeat protein
MRNLAAAFVLFLLMWAAGSCAPAQNARNESIHTAETPQLAELDELNRRFSIEYANLLTSSMWSLTHNYRDKAEVDEIMKLTQSFIAAISGRDTAKLDENGGVKGFKDKFAKYLNSEDDAVSGFAAVVLGIAGDASYAPRIAALLDKKDKSMTEEFSYPPVTFRGRAAVALGLLGAKEYKSKIAALLKSKNQFDRQGAITAFGYLGAKEYVKEVANLLTSREIASADDDSPVYFLIQNDLANDYKKELLAAALDGSGREKATAALYALARLDAVEYAADVATLLGERFRKGDAAKVLALMNAVAYADKIALLLSDENSLARKDAALALGILKSKKHAAKIAGLLTAEEDFVRYYAAVALVLMEASEYYKEALPIIEKTHRAGAYLNDGDFHPLVAEKSNRIKQTFKTLSEKAKS